MKRLIVATLLTIMSADALANTWTDPNTGITWTYSVAGGKAMVGSGSYSPTAVPSTTTGEIKIPSSLGGYPVTSIGSFAFYSIYGIESVDIPSGVTSIGNYAFGFCKGLFSVKIPSSTTYIGDYAFEYCSALTSFIVDPANTVYSSRNGLLCSKDGKDLIEGVNGVVTIPDCVTRILKGAFDGRSGLTSVSIPASVTDIGVSAFNGCTSLLDLIIPDTVTSIGDSAFSCCSGLQKVTIPMGVVSIGNNMFYACSGLTEVKIPSSVQSIGNSAFYGCRALTEVSIPSSVTTISEYAFHNCTSLSKVNLSEGLTSIGTWAFGYSKIESVSIPSTMTSIGSLAFGYCGELKAVTIPSGVSSVSTQAFQGCPNIYDVVVNPTGMRCLSIKRGKLVTIDGLLIIDCCLRVTIISSLIRENDPTIMDITYKIRSLKQSVKVRALAFEDGQRSFAKVVRPETFVDGTGVNVGDNITPNVEHKISWKVSSDWQTKLAKVKFEVLASEGELLPLETMTIPASDHYGKMKITYNAVSESQCFDALLWLFAEGDSGLSLSNGEVRDGEAVIANGSDVISIKKTQRSIFDDDGGYVSSRYMEAIFKPASEYILEKMGYSPLTGDLLTYVNRETRLGLSPEGIRRYGYKIVE